MNHNNIPTGKLTFIIKKILLGEQLQLKVTVSLLLQLSQNQDLLIIIIIIIKIIIILSEHHHQSVTLF